MRREVLGRAHGRRRDIDRVELQPVHAGCGAAEMPTIFTHPAVAIAAAPWFRRLPRHAVVVAAVCASLPDIDVISFGLGIPYGATLGHRGFTHSIVALGIAVLATVRLCRVENSRASWRETLLFFSVVTLSHGLLDAATNGGRGVGFLIPFSSRRFFFPFRPIQVSPIGAGAFLERAGPVLVSELQWVWLPALAIFFCGVITGRFARSARTTS